MKGWTQINTCHGWIAVPRIRLIHAIGTLLVLLAAGGAMGQRREPPGPPPNDECINAIPIDTGSCRVTGMVCGGNDECVGSEGSFDQSDCTGDPGRCTSHDL